MQLSPVPPQRQAPLVIPQDRPVYRIKSEKGFFGPDDNLYAEGEIIIFEDEPNPEMEPLNSLAIEKMREYLEKLDAEGRKVAEKTGKAYHNLADAFDNARTLEQQEHKKVQLISGNGQQTPLMRGEKKASGIARVALNAPTPQMGSGPLSLNPKNEVKGKPGRPPKATPTAPAKTVSDEPLI